MKLEFRVIGAPVPKGNMTAFVAKGRAIVTDDNRKALKTWQPMIAEAASRALLERPLDERRMLLDGVRLTAVFTLSRPKSVKRRHPITRPDLSKLIRGVEDALIRVLYTDDAQIVELLVAKRYGGVDEPPYLDVCVEPAMGVVPVAANLPLFGVPA